MDRIMRAMSLIHDLAVELKIFRNHKVILEPKHSVGVFLKTFSFTQLQSSNVYLLSSNDIFLDSWNEGYVVQSAMLNNPKTWLFWITTGCERLNY
jgi:hypothetical protein